MEYSFPRYLLAKQTVDDRALNRTVLDALRANLPARPLEIIEVGGGVGTMIARLLRWNVISRGRYTLVDEMDENIRFGMGWLPAWAENAGLRTQLTGENQLRLFDEHRDVEIHFRRADVFEFIDTAPEKVDLLIAHAFLDLLPMPDSLPGLFSLLKPSALAWLTVNFDGVTTLEPAIDPVLDAKIERLYHLTMDSRPTGGDSQAGRHLFGHIAQAAGRILSAGASDWVVYSAGGQYPADEGYFLQFILYFFEESLKNHPELDKNAFEHWLAARRAQVSRGELIYIAHQMDFLVKK
jgi:hypothetical protein